MFLYRKISLNYPFSSGAQLKSVRIYSRTSVARTLMARLLWLFRTRF